MDRKIVKVSDIERLELIAKFATYQLFQLQEYVLLVQQIAANNPRARDQLLKCVDKFDQLYSDRDVLLKLLSANNNLILSDKSGKQIEESEDLDNVVQLFPSEKSTNKNKAIL